MYSCTNVSIYIFICLFQHTARIHLDPAVLNADEIVGLKLNEDRNQKQAENIWNVYNLIYEGAHAFLFSEYQYIGVFVVVFSIILLVVLDVTTQWVDAAFTVIAFLVGCGTSVLGRISLEIFFSSYHQSTHWGL